jgi:hypothetical protein
MTHRKYIGRRSPPDIINGVCRGAYHVAPCRTVVINDVTLLADGENVVGGNLAERMQVSVNRAKRLNNGMNSGDSIAG